MMRLDRACGPFRSYRGRIVTPVPSEEAGAPWVPPLRFLEDGVLVVDAAGRIAAVEAFSSDAPGPVLDLRPHLIAPGFVDAHVHFPQARVIGSATGPLLDWLDRTVFPEEARFSDEAYAREVAAEFFGRMIACGTTSAGVYASSSPAATRVAFEACVESGMLAQIGLVLMDRGAPSNLVVPRDRAMADLAALHAARGQGAGPELAVTPRFALSCSRELLADAGEFAARHGLCVQTHLSENLGEIEATRAAFPEAPDYLGVYEAAGLVGERSLFAHAIHLAPREWERLAATRSCIVHCPDSNLFLGSGRMQLREALRRGIRTALGSDVAAGRTLDMRRIASAAYDTALAERAPVTTEELWSLATWCGADVLGFGDRTGALTPGRRADFVVIDVPLRARSLADLLGQALFASDVTRVVRTFLSGRSVHEG
ncbi:MAG: guanine deaminase [Polyangiaceae bacterium]